MGKDKNTKSSVKKELYDWADSLAVSLAIVVFLFNFVIMTVQVDGPSMENTLHDEERLIISNLFYEPKNFDIVVLTRDNDDPIIKRVIATEGQVIDIDEETGEVTVDGKVIDEPYIKEAILDRGDAVYPQEVPPNSIFVMGDNRNNSLDSRVLGSFENKHILGRVIIRISPFGKWKVS